MWDLPQSALPRIFMKNRISVIAVIMLASTFFSSNSFGQNLNLNPILTDSFTNARQIGSLGGGITQLAFDPNDNSSLYATTFFGGVTRFDYAQGGVISNPQQIISPNVNLNRDATHANGSYGIAFHDDPNLGSVLYLSRALINDTSFTPRTQGLSSIVRVNDANGDGTFGGAGDLNQTIADNVYTAQWTHQLSQIQVYNDTLYIGSGSLTSNGGVDYGTGTLESGQDEIGEAAHTASILFIEDLTQIGTGDNAAYFDIGDDLSDPNDVTALRTDTQVFESTDPGKLRVFSTGLRNPFGIAVNDEGELYVTNNQGGATADQPDELFQSSFQDDHGFNKVGSEVGDYKDPDNDNPSVQAARDAGFFATDTDGDLIVEGPTALLEANTAATGLDFVRAAGNDFDDFIVVARAANGRAEDVVLVNPDTGELIQLFDNENFGQVTDVIVDPFGDLLIGSSSENTISFVEVVGGTASVPEPSTLVLLGLGAIGFATRRRR